MPSKAQQLHCSSGIILLFKVTCLRLSGTLILFCDTILSVLIVAQRIQ